MRAFRRFVGAILVILGALLMASCGGKTCISIDIAWLGVVIAWTGLIGFIMERDRR